MNATCPCSVIILLYGLPARRSHDYEVRRLRSKIMVFGLLGTRRVACPH
jgi:hypothetical protein